MRRGRPASTAGGTLLHISISNELYDRLQRHALTIGRRRRSEVVAKALTAYLDELEGRTYRRPADKPVQMTLLREYAPERLDDIHTQGELVQYLVGCKGWSHDDAVGLFNGN